MSYCALHEFKNNELNNTTTFKNAWGGSAYIWNRLYNKYLKNPKEKHDNWLSAVSNNNAQALWELDKNPQLSEAEKWTHKFTFDWAAIKRVDFPLMAQCLKKFLELYPPQNKICHLQTWAELIKVSSADIITQYGTSISDDLWTQVPLDDAPWINDEDHDDYPYTTYNFEKGNKHFFLFHDP